MDFVKSARKENQHLPPTMPSSNSYNSMATKITNEEVMRCTGLKTIYFTLRKRRLRWLGHIMRMGDERIPKSMLYSELVDGTRKRGRPTLRFKDVCKRDLKSLISALIS